jgi:UDP-N-acetylmuramoyl-L-alanyl-D-glutamate--2,6-diaminopimelate ligase
MRLKEIIFGIENDILEKKNFVEEIEILAVKNNCSLIKKNDIFFAINGNSFDGHDFIKNAIEKGAIAIVCEKFPDEIFDNISYIRVKSSRIFLAKVCKNFYFDPSKKFKLIGVTGTCGKTSTCTFLYQIFKNLGYKTALISSIRNIIDQEVFDTYLTTPDTIDLYNLFEKMVEKKVEYCFMEVSSHSINQYRVFGLDFDIAIFTNLSQDHFDYHKDMLSYSFAKKKFFDDLKKEAIVLINGDDIHSNFMVQNCKSKVYKYSIKTDGDFTLKILENSVEGILIKIKESEIYCKIAGTFNGYNILAAYSCSLCLGIKKEILEKEISKINSVEGRFQFIENKNKKKAIIDYAHKPEAVKCFLEDLKKFNYKGKIITVIGCGGNRDKSKRKIMGKIASELSDYLILTSDNPRLEDPLSIIEDIYEGILEEKKNKTEKIIDRKKAIEKACEISDQNDIIAILGKGHENYQIIGKNKIYFSDKEIFLS